MCGHAAGVRFSLRVCVAARHDEAEQERRHATTECDRGLRNESAHERLAARAHAGDEAVERKHAEDREDDRQREDVGEDENRSVTELAPESTPLQRKRAMPKREMNGRGSRHETVNESSSY